jgi:hypothetical protein
LQSRPVYDPDQVARRLYQASAFQNGEDLRNARPAHAKQDGEELMGNYNVVVLEAVVPHQEPSREAFYEYTLPVRQCRLAALHHEGLSVTKHDRGQCAALAQRRPKYIGGNAERESRRLH